MIVTGFMGSPRKKGNTAFLLKSFLEQADLQGAETHMVHVPDLAINPCTGCALCEKKGYCHFDDDMQSTVFPLMRMSDVIVMAAPIYFYNAPAEMKAMIDRSQTLWSRKYKLGLKDPGQSSRKGFLLSVGATKGKDLFDSIHLTMKYFYLGIATKYQGSLTYSRIEDMGEMKRHPSVLEDVEQAVSGLLSPLKERHPTVLFVCRDNSLLGPMAQAYARIMAGDKIQVLSAGIVPCRSPHPLLAETMEQAGIDVAYRNPRSMDTVLERNSADHVVHIGGADDTLAHVPGARLHVWTLPESPQESAGSLVRIRNWVEDKVKGLINDISGATV